MMTSDHITLYHGTSKASAINILTEGSRDDYLEQVGALDLARSISALVLDSMKLHGKDTWEIGLEVSKRFMADDDNQEEQDLWVRSLPYIQGARSRSFQYGSVFVTSSITRAYRYSAGNPYRSEFLRAIAGGYGICRSLGPPVATAAEELRELFPRCFELLDSPSEPVVIEISGIPIQRLRKEDGDANIQDELELFAEFQELNVDPQLSFQITELRLSDVVSIHDLKGWNPEKVPTLASINHLRMHPTEWLSKAHQIHW